MSSADPFTLDLFETTALASGWTLGAPAVAAADVPWQPPSTDDEKPTDEPSANAASEWKGANFYLDGDRALAASWRGRARDNLAAIRLAASIAAENRPATPEEQAELIKFIGFGATDLANCFRRPGETEFRRAGRRSRARSRQRSRAQDYASLARCTQYAHYTPEFVIRAIWRGLQRLGFRGGRVLEPGMGTGLFSPCCPKRSAPSAISPASNTIRSPPGSRAWCIPGAHRDEDYARAPCPGRSTSRSAIRPSPTDRARRSGSAAGVAAA